MTQSVESIITGVVTGLGTAGLLVAIFIAYLRSLQEDNRQNKQDNEDLKSKDLAALKDRVDHHLERDRSQEIMTELKHMGQQLAQVDQKLDKVRDETTEQRTRQAADHLYIQNLDTSFQRHKELDHGRKPA